MSAVAFLYLCGCAPDDVGQRFVHGVLVCPLHGEPVAPGDAVEGPWRGRATVVLAIDARDHEEAALLMNALIDAALADDRIRDVLLSIEERT